MRAVPVLALLLVAGCGASAGSGGGQPCTEIGAPTGVGVDIPAGPVATRAATASLEACWGGQCQDFRVELNPSTAPQSTCEHEGNGTVRCVDVGETGGKHGFANITDLPEQPVRLTLTVTGDGGARVAHGTVDVTPDPVYPNGRHCQAMGPQAQLVVDARGQVREAL